MENDESTNKRVSQFSNETGIAYGAGFGAALGLCLRG